MKVNDFCHFRDIGWCRVIAVLPLSIVVLGPGRRRHTILRRAMKP